MRHFTLFILFIFVGALQAQECPPVNPTPMTDDRLSVTLLGTYQTGVFDEGAAEIADYDPINQQVVFTNADTGTVIILDASDPTNPTFVAEVGPPSDFDSDGINSVAFFSNGNFIASYEGEDTEDNGIFVTYSSQGAILITGTLGVLPDMITTDPLTNGNNQIAAISANEGEPDDDYTVDPLGSVTLIRDFDEITLDFTSFNSQEEALKAQGLRIFGPGATLAQDLEPEFIAVAGDSAYVICQENNGFAIVDLNTETIVDIVPFGFKDYSCAANAFDASNEDGVINLANYDVLGMYQPDAAVAYQVDGVTYLLTANEGDSRDYDGFSEEERVKDLVLDPTAYPDAATLQQDEVLGRLLVTTTLGDTDGDGDYDQLYSYGARSFSIFAVDGSLIWDSGSEFERILAELL
ncbi:MAG: choice-of-anchor I family protein, partial [Bacteroidota bacterium]